MHTIERAIEKLNNSAAVNRPHTPNDILFPSEHGRIMYWHIGNNKNANATVAITVSKRKEIVYIYRALNQTNNAKAFYLKKYRKLTCCTNGKQHLHRIKKEKHHK